MADRLFVGLLEAAHLQHPAPLGLRAEALKKLSLFIQGQVLMVPPSSPNRAKSRFTFPQILRLQAPDRTRQPTQRGGDLVRAQTQSSP